MRRWEIARAHARCSIKDSRSDRAGVRERGFLGATTRRIAQAAGVNEVTLFRRFGSKQALLKEAIGLGRQVSPLPRLPAEPAAPLLELTTWCRAHIERFAERRLLLRKSLAESNRHPELVPWEAFGLPMMTADLRGYVDWLVHRDLLQPRGDPAAAITMLLSTLLADGLGREHFPSLFPTPSPRAPEAYARAFLAAIGGIRRCRSPERRRRRVR